MHFTLTTEDGRGRLIWSNVNRIVPDTGMDVEVATVMVDDHLDDDDGIAADRGDEGGDQGDVE